MKIAIIGATGLIGNKLLNNLMTNDSKLEITTITRRKTHYGHNQIIYPDLSPQTLKNLKLEADHFICCLGTTIKQAGTKENFRKVDFDLVVEFSKLAKRSGAKSIHVVSSKGANPNSLIFYNRVKGEMETELKNTSIPSIYIYRPSLLIGEREEKRIGEKLSIHFYHSIKNILPISIKKQIGSEVDSIVKKMAENILGHQAGIHIIESSEF